MLRKLPRGSRAEESSRACHVPNSYFTEVQSHPAKLILNPLFLCSTPKSRREFKAFLLSTIFIIWWHSEWYIYHTSRKWLKTIKGPDVRPTQGVSILRYLTVYLRHFLFYQLTPTWPTWWRGAGTQRDMAGSSMVRKYPPSEYFS